MKAGERLHEYKIEKPTLCCAKNAIPGIAATNQSFDKAGGVFQNQKTPFPTLMTILFIFSFLKWYEFNRFKEICLFLEFKTGGHCPKKRIVPGKC
jgi:hypothetical protein